jgi:FkbM family methyltransferase
MRRLLRGRSVRRFPLVNRIYHSVFRLGHDSAGPDIEVRYRDVELSGPAWDMTIMPSVSGGYYEVFEVSIFERLAGGSRLVVDVGANIGIYACTGARHLPPGGRLVAFEPVPENHAYLLRNVTRNGLAERVVVERQAVGETAGELTLYLSGEQSGKHSAAQSNVGEPTDAVTVPMTSIDAYLAEHPLGSPDIIKIDVEGYEGYVLRGAGKTLQALPTLLFEIHPELQLNCGISAEELLDPVFAKYPSIFVIDELANVLRPLERADLDKPGTIGLYRSNLVAVGRADHLEVISEWCERDRPLPGP